MKKKILFVMVASTSFVLMSCEGPTPISNNWGDTFSTKEITNFDEKPDLLEISHGWTNGDPFNVDWNQDNVAFKDGKMELSVTDADEEGKYYGGEARTYDDFHYGNYEVTMKPMKASGTASTFFTYTGPSFDEDPHDEIDIEFLGKDTTKVQFNYFTNGVGGHEYMYDLGFDASEDYHTYGFRWEEDRIVWFVDDVAVYEATENIPSTPGRIFMNAWTGTKNAEAWMGKYEGSSDKTVALYDAIYYEDLEGNGYVYESGGGETGGIDISKAVYEDLDVTLQSTNNSTGGDPTYTIVDNEDGSYKVSYTQAKGNSYDNIYSPLTASDKNVVKVTLQNDSDKDVAFRLDVMDENIVTDGTTVKTNVINTHGYQDGTEVRTDFEWGGSFFTAKAKSSTEAVVIYDGAPTKLAIMLDSFTANEADVAANEITIKDFKIGTLDVGEEDGEEDDVPTEDTLEELELTWAANTDNTYTVTPSEDNKSYDVTYTNAKGNSYHNITAQLPSDAPSKNLFAMTLKNNTDQVIEARVDVLDTSIVIDGSTIKTQAVNVKATQDGVEVRTDLEWGGSFFTLKPNATSNIIIEYDGNATSLNLMLDSFSGQDVSKSGDVTISNFQIGTRTAVQQ